MAIWISLTGVLLNRRRKSYQYAWAESTDGSWLQPPLLTKLQVEGQSKNRIWSRILYVGQRGNRQAGDAGTRFVVSCV